MSGSTEVDLQDTFGAALIGVLVTTVLYGMTVIQIWIYHCHSRGRDSIVLKAFIAVLFILDTLHTILCGHSLYWYLIQNFGNVDSLGFAVWSINAQVCINGTTGYLVQLFYARRVYIISQNVIVPVIVAILGGICCSMTFVFTIRSFALLRFSRFGSLKWVTCVGLSTSAAADILIALAMCWYLYHKRTGFSRTDSLITTLMTYSINCGMLTSILATCSLVAFAVKPTKLYSDVFFWLMGKCYVNSFLAILNNRENFRTPSSNHSSNTFHMEEVRQNKRLYKSKTGPTAVAVAVHRTDSATSKDAYDNEQKSEKSEGITISSIHDGLPELTV